MPFGVSVEILANEGDQFRLRDCASAERFDAYADRLGNADGVGELNFTALGQAGSDDVLGDIAGDVCGGAIDLRRILAGESAASVTAHAAVAVDDNLAAGQSGVAHWTTDDEAPGGIDVVLGVFVEKIRPAAPPE